MQIVILFKLINFLWKAEIVVKQLFVFTAFTISEKILILRLNYSECSWAAVAQVTTNRGQFFEIATGLIGV